MKIFIIYASAGFGHKKIAESINETAITIFDKDSIRLIDILDFVHPFLKFAYSKGYIFIISKLKWLWAVLFYFTNTRFLNILDYKIRYSSDKFFCRNFINFIIDEQPDYVISTHFLVNELVSLLKGDNLIQTKIISVITDFGVHNFWLAKNIDIYAVASNKTKDILISRDVDISKIRVLGMPARKQFQKEIDANVIKKKLGIKENKFTILIITGGVGIGPIYEIIKLLNDRVNIIAICGYNKKLCFRLKELHLDNLIVLGWIDNVEEVMKVSDMVITKPGGSTISECLIMNLPMIFFSIIPGQEFQNAQIISQEGMGFIINNPNKIVEKILHFKENQHELRSIKNKIESFKIKDSSHKVLNLINTQ